jgi:LmbE family N-acetylglucosaminyl deacetylase
MPVDHTYVYSMQQQLRGFVMKSLVIGAHPDDIEVMLGYRKGDVAVVASNGEAGIDMTGTCLCPGRISSITA